MTVASKKARSRKKQARFPFCSLLPHLNEFLTFSEVKKLIRSAKENRDLLLDNEGKIKTKELRWGDDVSPSEVSLPFLKKLNFESHPCQWEWEKRELEDFTIDGRVNTIVLPPRTVKSLKRLRIMDRCASLENFIPCEALQEISFDMSYSEEVMSRLMQDISKSSWTSTIKEMTVTIGYCERAALDEVDTLSYAERLKIVSDFLDLFHSCQSRKTHLRFYFPCASYGHGVLPTDTVLIRTESKTLNLILGADPSVDTLQDALIFANQHMLSVHSLMLNCSSVPDLAIFQYVFSELKAQKTVVFVRFKGRDEPEAVSWHIRSAGGFLTTKTICLYFDDDLKCCLPAIKEVFEVADQLGVSFPAFSVDPTEKLDLNVEDVVKVLKKYISKGEVLSRWGDLEEEVMKVRNPWAVEEPRPRFGYRPLRDRRCRSVTFDFVETVNNS